MNKTVVSLINRKGLYFDASTDTLYMSFKFSTKATDLESKERIMLRQYKEEIPNLRVVVLEPKKPKSTHISYSKMILYISYQENGKELLDQFNEVKGRSVGYRNPYKHVLDWFEENCPGYFPEKKAS